MKSYKRLTCRLCKSKNLQVSINICNSPLANNLTKDTKKVDTFPLIINQCRDCYHYQLSHVVNPKILFDNYLYKTGVSKEFIKHFSEYANDLKKKIKFTNNPKALDIGANDGTLLKQLQKNNFECAGVDPAKNLVKYDKNLKKIIINDYFNKQTRDKLVKKYKNFDLICANNVFAHIDNLNEVFQLIYSILSDDGFIVFEVSYFKSVVDKLLFDTIYHEHLDYHTIKPLRKFLKNFKLNIVDLKIVRSHGGSLRFYVRKNHYKECHKKLNTFILKENDLNKINSFSIQQFKVRLRNLKNKITDFIKDKKKHQNIIGYTAPAKLTTLIHFMKISHKDLLYIIDDNELKNNKYIPNTKIKIINSYNSEIPPNIIIIFAWNLVDELSKIIKKRFKNSEIYVPLPKFKKLYNGQR